MKKFKTTADTFSGLDRPYSVSNLSSSDGMQAAVHRLSQLATSQQAFLSELRQIAQTPEILALIFSSRCIILRADPRVESFVTKTTTKSCTFTWSAKCWTHFPSIGACTSLATLKHMSPRSRRISSLLSPATSPLWHHQAAPTPTNIRITTMPFRVSTWLSRPSSSSLSRIKRREISRGMPLVRLAMSSRSSTPSLKKRRKRC